MTNKPYWMIYGANGYTGRLCAEAACRRGLTPILAGRNHQRIAALAKDLHLDYRIFECTIVSQATEKLRDISLVLNCAGPFSSTARPFVAACTTSKTHYLDITGEIAVFEYMYRNSEVWAKAGIAVLPGVGFDVVPSDCLAAMLKEKMPDATQLILAFTSKLGKISPGTAKTIVEGLAQGCYVRHEGELTTVPLGSLNREIPFSAGTKTATAISWGDVATAYYSTGIPTIEVYTPIFTRPLPLGSIFSVFSFLLRWRFLQTLVKRQIDARIKGPVEIERRHDICEIYGEVVNPSGSSCAYRLITPNGYSLTVDTALASVEKVLAHSIPPGFNTPSQAFGTSFILTLPGITLEQVP